MTGSTPYGSTPARQGASPLPTPVKDDHQMTSHLPAHPVEHPATFENPGVPPHVPRHGDLDPRAAKRSERQVLALFTLSMLASIAFVVLFWVFPDNRTVNVPLLGVMNALHVLLGLLMGLSLLGIGLGAVHWAKTLMPDHEVVEERHTQRSPEEDRVAAARILSDGARASQIGRRPLIGLTMGGALSLFALPIVAPLIRGLGPLPHDDLKTTLWKQGVRLVKDPDGLPIKAEHVTLGSVFHVLPEGYELTEHVLNEKAKASVLLMRLDETKIKSEKERSWGVDGIVAYSKICTHVGCPVGLYEQQTHHLLCPCHQSTFDVTDDCKVIFGPAGRPLPQLKITVDREGYLVADQGFVDPVGPSFWER